MNAKKVILFVVGIIILAIIVWPRGNFKITRIENGNTIVLNNGTTVHLIGVLNTTEAKTFLEDNFLNVKVTLREDSRSPFDPNHLSGTETVYAYVKQKTDGQCINATLIRSGLTPLDESSYLCDSLKAFKRYAELAH